MFGKLKFRLRHLLGVLRRFSGTRHAEPSKANLTYTSWDGLKLSTNVLNNKCEGFEHLASAFDSLLRCVEMFEDKVRARQDYAKLGMDMDELFSIFAQYLEQVVPPSITSDSATRLARGINKEAKVLLNHEEGHRQEEDMDSIENVDEALKCYRQVRTSLALFVMSENTRIWSMHDGGAFDTLLQSWPHSPEAHYRYVGPNHINRTGCAADTRVDVLQELRDWLHYGKFHNVYWLNGPAGTGKTAIAYSLCEYLEDSGKPAANFFCSQHLPDCRDVDRVLPTICYQLARSSRPFRWMVSEIIEQKPDLRSYTIEEQFERLIVAPMQKIGYTFGVDVVIVIDGLDECEDKIGANRLLQILFSPPAGLTVGSCGVNLSPCGANI